MMLLLGLAVAAALGEEAPHFERVVLDAKVGIGYGLALADVDGDGRRDVLLVDQHEVRWYGAPDWKAHLLCGQLTELDHVCIAARDIDGKPGCEVAIGAGWNPGDTVNSGALHWLEAGSDRAQPWTPHELPHEPTVHRMKWVRGADGRCSLVVVPLHGRGNQNAQGAGARILEYIPREEPEEKKEPGKEGGAWTTKLVDDSLHQSHNLEVVQWDGDPEEELVVCGREGIFLFDRRGRADPGWSRTELVGKETGQTGFPGASEVRVGRFSNGRRYLATVEPFHGNQLVIYVEPVRALEPWTRALLDDSFAEAHAVATGDLLGRGDDQLICGWRRPDRNGKTGLKLFVPRAADPPAFESIALDDHVACEDLGVGDLDGDGRLDLVAAGRDSHDLTLFLNRSTPPTTPEPSDRSAAASPERVLPRAPLDVRRLDAIMPVVEEALAQKKLPGCVVAIGRHDGIHWLKAFGKRSLLPVESVMTEETVFDLASLTKPIGTATSIMVLVERGKIGLDDPLLSVLPEFAPAAQDLSPGAEWKRKVTLRHCLEHTAGFLPDNELGDYAAGADEAWRRLFAQVPVTEPGTVFVYSDVGYELLGKVVERLSGRDLASFVHEELFAPLRMAETGYLPDAERRARAAPTEPRAGTMVQGFVHDPRAFALGGVAGHAGLFSTARDVARYARMLLNGGELDGTRILSPQGVARLGTADALPGGVLRTPGFDVQSRFSTNRGELMTSRAFGHGGFTGTGLWIDPGLDLFVLFLSNRVHPDGTGLVNPLIGRIGSIAAAAVGRSTAPPDPVLTGIDVLRREGFARLRGARVGLVTNQTGRARDGVPTIDLLAHAPADLDLKLVVIFTPEHGLDGLADAAVKDGVDTCSGIPVRSLYGEAKKPTRAMLAGVDTLLFDVQDAGVRCYTYVTTLGLCMEAAAENKLRFVVLDRPDPIGGVAVAGPVPDEGRESFTNYHPIALRHGMTLGELARMFRSERGLALDLDVVPLQGWRRAELFDATGLPWVNPSPNLRTQDGALLYPGLVLFEATNLSVGRGTDLPFEQIGAPWLDAVKLVEELTAQALPGVAFKSVEFTPASSVFAGERCHGVRLEIVDRAELDPLRVALEIAVRLRRLHASLWKFEKVDVLACSAATVAALRDGKGAAEIEALWKDALDAFTRRRAAFLLYE